MNLLKKIARKIENELGFTNGWKIPDEEYSAKCHKIASDIVGQLDCRVSNDFCGNCTYLSVTEEEQNSNKKDEIHFCNLFKQRVLHFDKHPNLPRLDECKIIGKR